jgi:methionyl-tRNA formyltransferase
MRIVFMGTPAFARASLNTLYDNGCEIAAVFTQPDKPRGRGMKPSFSPVKELAIERGTMVYQPTTLKDGEATEIIAKLGCDLIVVVAYGRLLPNDMLALPPLGCVNIHASLLPKYRGAAPIQHAIMNGEDMTGVTSAYITEQLDAGDMIFTKKTPIRLEDTAADLHDRLAKMGSQLLADTIYAIERGEAPRIPQNDADATYAPPIKKEIAPIDWTQGGRAIRDKVRALNPWPVATAGLGGTTIKVFTVESSAGYSGRLPGEILSAGEHGIEVACSDGSVTIKELQAPGGKRMPAADYLRGHPIRL